MVVTLTGRCSLRARPLRRYTQCASANDSDPATASARIRYTASAGHTRIVTAIGPWHSASGPGRVGHRGQNRRALSSRHLARLPGHGPLTTHSSDAQTRLSRAGRLPPGAQCAPHRTSQSELGSCTMCPAAPGRCLWPRRSSWLPHHLWSATHEREPLQSMQSSRRCSRGCTHRGRDIRLAFARAPGRPRGRPRVPLEVGTQVGATTKRSRR